MRESINTEPVKVRTIREIIGQFSNGNQLEILAGVTIAESYQFADVSQVVAALQSGMSDYSIIAAFAQGVSKAQRKSLL